MISTETSLIAEIHELLAGNGYDVTVLDSEMLRVRDLETGVAFQAVLQGNVLYMSVTLTTVSAGTITAELMQKMLASDNGISTSAFQLYNTDGKVAVTLNNFCTLQNMQAEDEDDILSLAGYLMADLVQARELLGETLGGVAAA